MDAPPPVTDSPGHSKQRSGGRLLRIFSFGCGGCLTGFAVVVVLGLLWLSKVLKTFPGVAQPIQPSAQDRGLGGGLADFESPYLGHTGSWDGKGGTMTGGTKERDLDVEKAMGLKWTFMAVNWRAMEPKRPVNLEKELPPEWRELDRFVSDAQARGLNILMQAPVVGGNAQGAPEWAGRREPGKSAPQNMQAGADFAGKLARRYRPGGALAKVKGWGERYGVRAWELDNEPESYPTHWRGQAGDYAEFVTQVANAIKAEDSQAVIVAPAVAGGSGAIPWLEEALDAARLSGSPAFRARGKPHSIGKATDVVSFHCYEGLETAFAGTDRTIERDFSDIRAVFEKWEGKVTGFEYARKQDYWHTEGNFDFLGIMSAERRAAWRFQFMTRGFAAGIRKLAVMDASAQEQAAVRAYVRALPHPYPMVPATGEISITRGQVAAFKHMDSDDRKSGRVWVVWAVAGAGDATVELPTIRDEVTRIDLDGQARMLTATNNRVLLELRGDPKMAPGILLIDRKGATN